MGTTALNALYGLAGLVTTLGYLPQITLLWRVRDGARGISIATWATWMTTSLISCLYAACVVRDLPLVLVALANFAGCASVTGLAVWQRLRPCEAVISNFPEPCSPNTPRTVEPCSKEEPLVA
jgi:hypothetical protein